MGKPQITSRPMSIEEFLPLLGKAISVECEPRSIELELIEATRLTDHVRLGRPPFILIFRSPPEAALITGTYVMRGRGFGPDAIYIERIMAPATGAAGNFYQAVFN